MTFGFGSDAGYILWQGFKVNEGEGGKFFGAILFILLLAILTEGLSFLMWKANMTGTKAAEGDRQIFAKAINSLPYCVLRLLNYCQMLVAMTFNFWLILMIAVFQYIAWFCFQEIKDGMVLERETTKLLS